MEKPTLEEVKEYFKNADKCIDWKKDEFKIEIDKIKETDRGFVQNGHGKNWGVLWIEGKGYAKILTYNKPEFRPIAMRCNQEQFEAIKPKLRTVVFNTAFKDYTDEYPYLSNCYDDNKVCLGWKNKWLITKEKIHETWNEKVFLEACGIEVKEEETFVITKEQIKEFHKHGTFETKQQAIAWFPQAFEEDKKKLPKDFTGWCKMDNYTDFLWICYYEKGVLKYGIDSDGIWFVADYKEFLDGSEREATSQEVSEALEKEAVRRGFKTGVYFKDVHTNSEFRLSNLHYEDDSNDLRGQTGCVFFNGKWAEICETITKEEAEKLLNKKII